MSDAKAKAEARRAKILARESNRISAAKGENEVVEQEQFDDEKQKGRPLAARRNLVKSLKSSNESSSSNNLNEINETSEDKKIDESTNESSNKVSEIKKDENEEPKLVITPQSTKLIEKEIAEKTAKFDKNVLDKSDSKNKKAVKKPVNPNSLLSSPFQVVHAMKIIRLLGVIAIGMIMGYRSAKYHSKVITSLAVYNPKLLNTTLKQASKLTVTNQDDMIISDDEYLNESRNKLKQFINKEQVIKSEPITEDINLDINVNELANLIKSKQSFSTVLKNGTWIGWIIDYFIRQAESTITAVSLSWWITSLFHPLANKLLSSNIFTNNNTNKGSNILSKLLDLYAKGIEGLVDGTLNTIGDLALHWVVIVTTSLVVTFFFSDTNTITIPTHNEL